MKYKHVEIPILNNEYKVIVCFGTPDDVNRVLRKFGFHPEDTASTLVNNRGLCFSNPGCHPLIAMPCPPKTAEQIGTLAHEAAHAIEHIFNFVNQPLGGELFAHSVGAVVRETLNAVRMKKKVKNERAT